MPNGDMIVSLLAVVMPAIAVAGGVNYFNGEGTAYTLGQVSAGNCNLMYDPGVGENYAALNNEQWDSTLNCGRCAQVSCDDARCSDTTSSTVVYLVDRCPECAYGDLDLSPTVFKQVTGSDPSRYKIKWKFVDCPVSGNINYCTKSGSSSSWLAVQPANFANGVASMKIANQKVTMVDSCYYFLLNGGANIDISAVDIELTSVSGEIITETLSLSSDSCTVGTANFGTSTSGQTNQSPLAPVLATPEMIAPSMPLLSTPTTTPPATPTGTPTATPTSTTAPSASYTYTGGSSSQSPTQQSEQSEVSESFSSLQTNSSSSSKKFKAGEVIAANELGSKVKILQASEAGVEKTSRDEAYATKETAASEIEHVTTKSKDSSSGTSTVVVGLAVLAVVAGIALAAVVYVVKKKTLDDKRIDRDMAMMRSFDTFSSPVRFDATIAKI